VSRDTQARLVRSLFQQFEASNERARARTGGIDVREITVTLAAAMEDEQTRRLLIPALAFFIGNALDGSIMPMTTWTPPK